MTTGVERQGRAEWAGRGGEAAVAATATATACVAGGQGLRATGDTGGWRMMGGRQRVMHGGDR